MDLSTSSPAVVSTMVWDTDMIIPAGKSITGQGTIVPSSIVNRPVLDIEVSSGTTFYFVGYADSNLVSSSNRGLFGDFSVNGTSTGYLTNTTCKALPYNPLYRYRLHGSLSTNSSTSIVTFVYNGSSGFTSSSSSLSDGGSFDTGIVDSVSFYSSNSAPCICYGSISISFVSA